MIHRSLHSCLFVTLLFLIIASSLSAEDKKAPQLPKSGVLSSVGNGLAGGGLVYGDPWGGLDAGGDELPPISGGVSRAGTSWKAKVKNNTTDKYSVNVELLQMTKTRSTLKTDSFSAVLAPGASVERTFLSATSVVGGAELRLVSWKNLSPKKNNGTQAEQATNSTSPSKK